MRRWRLLRRIVLALTGLFLGLCLYLANANWIVRDPMPMPFGVGMATVMSGSMEPTLGVGDLVIVRQADDVGVGDIVVFEGGANLVVHRVRQIGDGELVTRGDANAADDAPVPASAVKGVVAFHVPVLGGAAQALRSPVGIAAVLVVAVAVAELSRRAGDKDADRQLDEMREEIDRLRGQAARTSAAGVRVGDKGDGLRPSETGLLENRVTSASAGEQVEGGDAR